MDKKQIRIDRITLRARMRCLREHPEFNSEIEPKSDNYMYPKHKSELVNLNDSRGLFRYYSNLHTVLSCALTSGFIPEEWMPKEAPDYLREITA